MQKRGERPSGRATIKDVALAAQVSPMTVSNVINGKLQFVSKATQAIVNREIERLGYRVQMAGRNLRRSTHQAIALVIVDDSPSFLADPFTANLVAGLSNALSLEGFSLTIQGVKVAAFGEASFLRNFEVDAICAILSGPQKARMAMVEALLQQRQPVILFQEPSLGGSPDLFTVRQDDEGGARMVTRHLLKRGAQRILFMRTKEEWPAMSAREAGVVAELKDHQPAAIRFKRLLCSGEDVHLVQQDLAAYLEKEELPDTIIGGNDRIALAAMALLQSRRIGVPSRVRVAGFNAFEPRQYVHPLLTTVESPAYGLGAIAAEFTLRRLREGAYPAAAIVLPVRLQIGKST
jgi:DNA-binding LacI/PurR family transcriptional regulator